MVKNEYLKILQSPRKNVEIFIFLSNFNFQWMKNIESEFFIRCSAEKELLQDRCENLN